MTEAEIFHEALVTPRRAFVPLPDLQLVERPGWLQIITPSFRRGGFNEVAFSALFDDEADRVIDETIAGYRALDLRFRWAVQPGSAPADLGARLARRGLVAHTANAMARALDTPLPDPPATAASAITVEEVNDANVDDYTRAMAEGWSTDPAPLADLHRLILAMPERTHRMYLARDGERGDVVGSAGYVAFPRSAFLLGAVTLPQFRRRGVYRALVAARLDDARRRGIPLATTHARADTSSPLLEKLGFRTVASFESYAG